MTWHKSNVTLTKFHCKNACAMAALGILVNGVPTQILIFFLKIGPNFRYVIQWNTIENQDWLTFAYVWCLCNKLCKVFDEAFLFDVSIRKYRLTSRIWMGPYFQSQSEWMGWVLKCRAAYPYQNNRQVTPHPKCIVVLHGHRVYCG